MSKGLEKRLNHLENSVLERPEVGSTKICTCAWTEPEQVLMEKARQLALKEIPYDETTAHQRIILDNASKLLNFRVYDLFTSYLEGLLCQEDKIARIVLHERFLWFIRELKEEIRQNLEVTELEQNAPKDSEVDVVDEYFRKARETFTPESYDKLTTELTLEILKGQEGKNREHACMMG